MKLRPCLALLGILVLPATSFADPVIASGPIGVGWGLGGFPVTVGATGVFFVQFPWRVTNAGPELFNFAVGPDIVGHTFRATASDANFDDAVAILTNGVDDEIGAGIRYPDGVWSTNVYDESQVVGRRFGSLTPDLRGATITAITVTFSRFSVREGPRDRDVSSEAVIAFEGSPAATPEPASVFLTLSGCCGLLLRRRARLARVR
ncbi:MAG TPA: PEP-CTERM sorting domain-containing protein [Vicinamibacterales bacterium]|nr:PEP-CTERM sorting domain-containing protein [Vicinamibacterales bacterium]